MALYQQQPVEKVGDAWVVNDVGRAVSVKLDSPQYDYAARGMNGWRLASAEEQAAGIAKMEADGRKWREAQDRELAARVYRRGRPMMAEPEVVVPKKDILKGGK